MTNSNGNNIEDFLESRLKEMQSSQSKYDDLYKQYQLSVSLFEERELLYQGKINNLTSILIKLQDRINKLEESSKNLEQQNEILIQEKSDLMHTYNLNEEHQRASYQKLYDQSSVESQKLNEYVQNANNELHHLKEQINEKQDQILSLQKELTDIKLHNLKIEKELKDESVSKSQFEKIDRYAKTLEMMIETEMTSKVQYDKALKDIEFLQEKINTDYVNKHEYNLLHTKIHYLEERVLLEYVSVEKYQSALNENKKYEVNFEFLQEQIKNLTLENQQQLQNMEEYIAINKSLKERIEVTEAENLVLKNGLLSKTNDYVAFQSEMQAIEASKNQFCLRNEELEKQNISLLNQLNNLQLVVNREISLKQDKEKKILTLQGEKASLNNMVDELMQEIDGYKNQKELLNELNKQKENLEKERQDLLDSVKQHLSEKTLIDTENKKLKTELNETKKLIIEDQSSPNLTKYFPNRSPSLRYDQNDQNESSPTFSPRPISSSNQLSKKAFSSLNTNESYFFDSSFRDPENEWETSNKTPNSIRSSPNKETIIVRIPTIDDLAYLNRSLSQQDALNSLHISSHIRPSSPDAPTSSSKPKSRPASPINSPYAFHMNDGRKRISSSYPSPPLSNKSLSPGKPTVRSPYNTLRNESGKFLNESFDNSIGTLSSKSNMTSYSSSKKRSKRTNSGNLNKPKTSRLLQALLSKSPSVIPNIPSVNLPKTNKKLARKPNYRSISSSYPSKII